jgi:hypothetical protein
VALPTRGAGNRKFDILFLDRHQRTARKLIQGRYRVHLLSIDCSLHQSDNHLRSSFPSFVASSKDTPIMKTSTVVAISVGTTIAGLLGMIFDIENCFRAPDAIEHRANDVLQLTQRISITNDEQTLASGKH